VRPTCCNKAHDYPNWNSAGKLGNHGGATSWSRTQTFDSVLDEMVSAGYSGTDLGPWGFLPTDPKRLMALSCPGETCV
jgi:hypothetical protein